VVRLTVYLGNFLPVEKIALNWWSFFLLIVLALIIGFLTEMFSVKRILKFAVPFVLVWAGLSFIAAKYYSVNTFFMQSVSVIFLPIFFVHLKKLWLIDSELTDKLVELASAGHILEGKSAEVR